MKFKIALAQIAPQLGDQKANIQKHVQALERAAAAGVQLIVFPELSLTGYTLKDLTPDMALDPDVASPLQQIAAHSGGLSAVVGFVEQAKDFKFYNSVAFLEDKAVRHVHRKVYLPTYGMFDEKRFFAAGDLVRVADTHFGKLGFLICEDIWHFSTAYLLAHQGALMIVASMAGPGRGVRGMDSALGSAVSWEVLTRTVAQFNTVYVVAVNRVGFEDGVNFFGGSLLVDPYGNVVARGKTLDEDLVIAEVDFDLVRRARAQVPLLRDENIELTMRELERISRDRFELPFLEDPKKKSRASKTKVQINSRRQKSKRKTGKR
ncbi:MAG: carbon-nitrogen hydrolase [Acidobacteriia bacterium]|nr:carbon-nitrogen hydrolase [Terriglobia bacterium]